VSDFEPADYDVWVVRADLVEHAIEGSAGAVTGWARTLLYLACEGGAMKVPTELIGCEILRTSFDYQVRLMLVGLGADEGYRVDAELMIETPFLMRDASGEWHELDPGTGSALAPALDLFKQTVTAVEVSDRGALTLDFSNEAQLFVGPHAQFKSWHLSGTGVQGILVGPGGETDWQR
jgi:hypothetical protein